jgi:hypothetical protein
MDDPSRWGDARRLGSSEHRALRRNIQHDQVDTVVRDGHGGGHPCAVAAEDEGAEEEPAIRRHREEAAGGSLGVELAAPVGPLEAAEVGLARSGARLVEPPGGAGHLAGLEGGLHQVHPRGVSRTAEVVLGGAERGVGRLDAVPRGPLGIACRPRLLRFSRGVSRQLLDPHRGHHCAQGQQQQEPENRGSQSRNPGVPPRQPRQALTRPDPPRRDRTVLQEPPQVLGQRSLIAVRSAADERLVLGARRRARRHLHTHKLAHARQSWTGILSTATPILPREHGHG